MMQGDPAARETARRHGDADAYLIASYAAEKLV